MTRKSAGARRRGHRPSRGPSMSPDLRLRQRLRQDDARLAPRGHRHRARAGPPARRGQLRDLSEFNTPGVAPDSSSRSSRPCPDPAGSGRQAGQHRARSAAYLQYKYGTFFPIITSASWAILALSGDARGRGAPRQPGVRRGDRGDARRRIALEKLARPPRRSGDRRPWSIFWHPVSSACSGRTACPATRSPLDDRGRLRRSGCVARWRSPPGPWRSPLAPFVGRGSAAGRRRRGHVRRVHRQRLPGGDPDARAARKPDLVRLDVEPRPAGRAGTTGRRCCPVAVVVVVLFVDRRRGVRRAATSAPRRRSRAEPAAGARRPARA